MQNNSKLVIEVLRQVRDTHHLAPNSRLRGLKPSAVAYAFAERLIGYREFQGNTALSAKGRDILLAQDERDAGGDAKRIEAARAAQTAAGWRQKNSKVDRGNRPFVKAKPWEEVPVNVAKKPAKKSKLP